MVRLRTAIVSVSNVILPLDIISFGRSKGVLNTSNDISTPFSATPFRVTDVTSAVYTTVFQNTYKLEDVGFLEVQDIFATLNQDVLGNGQLRWQLSGDGGTTFSTVVETAVFNVTAWTQQNSVGGGIWASQINAGDNKLQLRMQTRAVAGTVKSRIFDSSTVSVRYRKRVLS